MRIMFGLRTWWQRRYAKHPQHFHLRYSIALPAPAAVLAIPYPIAHAQQRVTDLSWDSDGDIVDHGGCLIARAVTTVLIEAEVDTRPFQASQPLPLSTDQPPAMVDHLYLEPDQFIQPNLPEIVELAKRYRSLPNIYAQALRALRYGGVNPGLYTTTEAIQRAEVDCGGFSTYLAALARAAGIPARLVAGFWAGYEHNDMHAWVECALPDGSWLPIDTSTAWLRQQGRTGKLGGLGELGSDRIVFSVGSHHELQISHTTYRVGMLQLPMQLRPDGTFSYLSYDHYRIITER